MDYVPPEMVKGDSYNETIDNWSLGILAFEFLVGKPPFEHSTKLDTLNSIIKEEIVFPTNLNKDAVDFIKLLIVKDPSKRV